MKMFNKNNAYKKVRGMGRHLAGYSQLWMGPDHLLSVTTHFVEEQYKRFFYKDIQAIIIKPTITGIIWLVIALLIALFSLWGILFFDIYGLLWILLPTAFFIAFMIFQKGTCKCWIKTSAQCEALPSVKYRRRARKLIEKVRPFIESAQGGAFNPETLTTYASSPGLASPNFAPGNQVSGGKSDTQPVEGNLKKVRQYHKPLYVLTLITGVLTLMEYWFDGVALSIVTMPFTFALWILLVIALVRQAGPGVSSGLKNLTWANGIFNLLILLVGYIVVVTMVIKNPEIGNNQWLMFKAVAEFSPHDSPLANGINIFHMAGSVFLGVIGLVMALAQNPVPKKAAVAQATSVHLETAMGEEL
ncbi:MAG: hypothetical protein JEZ02_15905 [Desulfatibacillum sp.]|nr:hypothetical protein [Desulfatibacillum sp.]